VIESVTQNELNALQVAIFHWSSLLSSRSRPFLCT